MGLTGGITRERIYEMREYQVVKSNEIIEKVKYNLTATEQKVLLFSISKIKPKDELNQTYEFKIKDFCDVVGIDYSSGSNIKNIKKAITNVSNKGFFILTDKERRQWDLVNWYNKVTISESDGMIYYSFGEFVNKYLLNLTRNFTQYKLLSILPMKSNTSIRLYELLKANNGKMITDITFDVDEIQEKLMIQYNDYNNFKKRVLDKAVEEINYYSDINVDYKPIREGRSIKAIEFTIRELSASERYLNSIRAYESLDKK
jgi:plasmid replication initiation protein